jgi:trigger factor
MNISVEETGELGRRLTVQVPAERINSEVQSRLQSMSSTVRLDGFRPGKVPIKVIEQKYGEQIRNEVVNQVIQSTLQEAVTQENLRPAGEPSVEVNKPISEDGLEYVASFEVFPEFGDKLNFNFKITRPTVEITDADISAMFDNLRRQKATWNEVGRPAQQGDQVTIDFEGTISGKPFTGNKAQHTPLVIGSGTMIPGFEEQLIGESANDSKVIEVTFPVDYPSKEVSGKTAQFDVKIHSVAEMELPPLDDNFAAAFGVSDGGLDALKNEVTENMKRELRGLVTSKMKDQVFRNLLDNNPFEIPKSLVDSEVQSLQTQENYQGQAIDALEKLAERRIKLGLLASEISKRNQIELDQDRVRELVETVAASYEKPDEVIQWYFGNQEMLESVQSAVMEEQVVDWVVVNSGAQIEELETTFNDLVEEAKQSQG